MNMRFVLAIAGGLLAGSPMALHAATFTKFTDRAAFTAAAGIVGIESFTKSTPLTKVGSGLDFGPFTVSETHYGSVGGGSQILSGGSDSVNGSNYLSASLYAAGYSSYGSYLTFTFDTPITAFGGNWVSGSSNRMYLDVLGSMVDGQAPNGGGFFGFVSDTPFTTLVMRARFSNFTGGLDNMTFSSSAAPEPASWAMMVGGFGLIGGAMRSRRKSRVSFA